MREGIRGGGGEAHMLFPNTGRLGYYSRLTFACASTQPKSLGGHVGDGGPLVSSNIKLLPTLQRGDPVKPTNRIQQPWENVCVCVCVCVGGGGGGGGGDI